MTRWQQAGRQWNLFLSTLFLKWSLELIPESDLSVDIATLYESLCLEFAKIKD